MSDTRLEDFVAAHRQLFVLTGAGCSTASGIPDYRDEQGAWKRTPPVTYQAFTGDTATRHRYWARSMIGWPRVATARPNDAHRALASLEAQGRCEVLLTQNVDGLHQAAGSHAVIDLHGRLDGVVCLACGEVTPRAALQARLMQANPGWIDLQAGTAPDGDADLEEKDFERFHVPACEACGGMLKPHVVFFGENVPADRVARCYAAVEALGPDGALLVAGSSLTVMSGLRFVKRAAAGGTPIVIVNRGLTRGDALATYKLDVGCSEFLTELASRAA